MLTDSVAISLNLFAQNEPIDTSTMVILGVVVFLLILGLILLAVFLAYFRWWVQAFFANAKVGFMDLIGMSFRKVKAGVIVPTKIMAVQAGIVDPDLTTKALEAHYLAGGNVPLVVRSLVAAHKAKTIQLSFREASTIDLAGRNILEAV